MILQSFKMAWKAVSSNKLRSFLTMLGIIIGVYALIVLVSLVSGATTSVTDSINSLGSNMLSVSIMDDKENPLKMSDLETFAEDEEIDEVAPVTQTNMTLTNSLDEESVIAYGTNSSYFHICNLDVEYGRLLKKVDGENHTYVAVVSAALATEVLGRSNVVGETISLDSIPYTIIGVLEEEESTTSTLLGSTYMVYLPYETLIRQQSSLNSDISSFYASATRTDSLEYAEDALDRMLSERFNGDEDAYNIINQDSIMEVMSSVTSVLSLLLGGIAGISLLVGGIGIMNIMLVSVTERTREIGIRKAIGASRGTIMMQFLIEAMVVSMMGCIVGVILSLITMEVINIIGNVDYSLNAAAVLVSVVFSLLIGLLFGLYPANKAAKKHPIDALRYQ